MNRYDQSGVFRHMRFLGVLNLNFVSIFIPILNFNIQVSLFSVHCNFLHYLKLINSLLLMNLVPM